MKTFSTLITESNITVPQFKHKDLNNPRDEEGKFWKAITAANEESPKASKGAYAKAIKLAKELYSVLVGMPEDEDIVDARHCASEAVKYLEKSSGDAIEELGSADLKQLRNYIFIIANVDEYLSHKNFYKGAQVDIKAGYVPFKGAAKDPKIKYRMVVRAFAPISEQIAKDIVKSIRSQSPLHSDYVAGIEWNKDKSAFAVLFTNSPGYKR